MPISVLSVLLLSGVVGLLSGRAAGTTGESLPLPCRPWTSCGKPVCTTEEEYQQAAMFNFPSHCFGANSLADPPAAGACVPVDGACNFTDNILDCRSWLPECTFSHQCGTEQEYQQYLNDSVSADLSCPSTSQLPAPDAICTQIDGACQWYDPCQSWQGICFGPYLCGNTREYWAYQYGPQPVCLPPGKTHVPPGECVLQDGQCAWSDCKAWLDWCGTSWNCDTQYEYERYLALPVPPCAPPGDNQQQPEQPGLCKFNLTAGVCHFFEGSVCPEGKEWDDCGTPCRLTCDNYENPPFCLPGCAVGCFCPDGMVERGEECVLPSDCSSQVDACAVVDCVPGYVCRVHEPTNSPYCDPTCEESSDLCGGEQECKLLEEECGSNVPCPHRVQCIDSGASGCAAVLCARGTYCKVHPLTLEPYCEPSCEGDNAAYHCFLGLECQLVPGNCDSSIETCPQQVQCSSKVECTLESCDDGKRCVVQESAKTVSCLQSCFVDNGGCREDQICVNQPVNYSCGFGLEPCSTVKCIDFNGTLDLQCSPGTMYSTNCESACPSSCESHLAQEVIACPAVCVEGCICPRGLVTFRDRCVDPLECWSLLNDPPPIDPLPLPSNTVLLELTMPEMTTEGFDNLTEVFIQSVFELLTNEGIPPLTIKMYAVQEMEDSLVVYLLFTGVQTGVTELDGEMLAEIITENNDLLILEVSEVSAFEGGSPAASPTVLPPEVSFDDTEDSEEGISDGVLAGVVVSMVVLVCCVVVIALVVMIVIVKKRSTKVVVVIQEMDKKPTDVPVTYSKIEEIASLENEQPQ